MRGDRAKQPGAETTPANRRPSGNALSCYLSDIREYRVLDRDEEADLARAARDGKPRAFERLIEANLRFVVKIANEYRHMGLPVEDLINEGNLGLMEAARRFDPERGVRFISWAVWWVRRAMRQALTDQTHVVRLPGSQVKRMREVQAQTTMLTKELGRAPEDDELAETLSFDPAKLDSVHRDGLRTMRLDEPISADDPKPAAAVLADERLESADETVIREETVRNVLRACASLDEQECAVLGGRFGLAGIEEQTLGAVGERIGRSRERVRQIELQAMARLRCRYLATTRPPLRVPERYKPAPPAA